MKYRHLFSTVCFLLMGVISAIGQNNAITIPDVTANYGRAINLPVVLDNTSDVVAVQFTLAVPEGITLDVSSATLTERSNEHSVTIKNVGNNKYMAMVLSSKNNIIKGRTGKLLYIPLTTTNNLKEGTEHQLTLSDVVIGARDGSNLATGFNAGKVTIAKSPDLEVSQVVANETNINPDGKVNVKWTVSNIGVLPTTGGWSEQILLTNDQGSTKLLGTLYNDEVLNAGGVVSRNAELNIPSIIGMDGKCRIIVRLVPNSNAGEPSWLQENNTAQTANSITANKQLSLTPDNSNIDEANAKTVRFQLNRSGNTTNDEVFVLTRNADSRIILPESITIEKGMSSTYFYAQVAANNILDNDSIVRFSITGNNYSEISSLIKIEDDTYPSLSISTTARDVTEGGNIIFTVSTQRASQSDIEVKMTCDFAPHFKIPTSIIIPAGQTNVDVNVEAVEDDVPNVEEVVTFTVTAAKHNPASVYTVLVDNDIPTLQLEITPTAVSEAAGPLALTAKIRRTDKKDKIVTIKLTDDSEGNIYYANQTVKMGAGVEETSVLLGPIDNAVVEGDRTYNISAAVWIASCSCNVNNSTSGGVVTVPITIYDNDGPTLTLSSASSVLKEGAEMTIKVKRNTNTEKKLVVSLSTSANSDIEYPATIEIPAGSTEVAFSLKSKNNDISNDNQTIMLTAESTGFSKSSIWLTLSDQTLPDARIANIEVSPSRVEVSEEVEVTVCIENAGMAALPKGTKVNVYMGNSLSASSYLQEELKVGDTKNIVCKVKSLNYVATCNVYAVVNEECEIDELSYTNNSSNVIKLETVSPYSITLQTDKAVYDKSDKITISGVVNGRNVASQQIDVYVINDGYRHVINTTTSEDGTFNVSYEPYREQMGHFVVGACYPNENSTQELTSFDIYGMKRTSSSYIKCEALLGTEYKDSYSVTNPGILSLSGLQATIVSKPDNLDVNVSVPDDVKANDTFNVAYDINATTASEGNEWQKIIIRIDSKEGASLITPLYYYCRKPMGKLQAEVASINTSMVKGNVREYPLVITNGGKGETGNISLELPKWMHTATPANIPSLSYGNSTTIILTFSPTEDMQLNIPLTGTIGINCEHGDGLSLPFRIEPVSDVYGTLTVDVCDENTYYTAESPHVADAYVTIMNPSTNSVMYQGKTGADGIYSVSLPEGFYKVLVTSENHDSFSGNILVDPEKERNLVVDLSISAIKVTYSVEETEIEDMYRIKTTTEYETRVPVPVVVVEGPTFIDGDNMKAGESVVVNFSLTNKGLIKAQEIYFDIPESTPEWEIKALGENEFEELAPQQSVFVPVMITKLAPSSNAKAKRKVSDTFVSACMAGFSNSYKWNCGKSLKSDKSLYRMALKTCANSAILQGIFANVASSGSGGGGNNGGSDGPGTPDEATSDKDYHKATDNTDKVFESPMCDPNYTKCADELLKKLFGMYPGAGKILNKIDKAADASIDAAENGNKDLPPSYYYNVGKDTYKEIKDALKNASKEIQEGASDSFESPISPEDIKDILEKCQDYLISKNAESKNKAKHIRIPLYSVDSFVDIMELYREQLLIVDEILWDIFGDEIWYKELTDDKEKFFDFIASTDGNIDVNSLGDYLPTSVPIEKTEKLMKRFNNASTDAIDWQKIRTNIDAIHAMDDAAIEKGYESLATMCKKAIADKYEDLTSSSNNVCSKIQLEFTQNVVMTRQAFRGTLKVYNGSEHEDMKDISLTVKISDSEGNLATSHEFQIAIESLEGFDKDDTDGDVWGLGANKNGTAKILFIPTKYAAPVEGKPYHFGGTLTYTDPFSGLKTSRELTPVTLTVKPSPNLDLTYFMQRDIKGDDPLTEKIEPCEEAEFSLLINNIGYGDATDVKMFTEQPKIVDNEKGLFIDFELMSSQLNSGEKTLALGGTVATDFGTIPAKRTSYAQWWIKSSLLGHFTDYNVEATHVTSYGNPDLSLLNDVTIHELIRSLDVEDGSNKLVGFMTNDIVDAEDMPDMLYLSNGEIETVALTQNASISKVSDTEYSLSILTSRNGWNYGNVVDPTYGISSLKSVVRQSDGKEMSLRNFWQTDRTLRDGKDPLYENRIHFADNIMSGNGETYILTFEPTPELLLEVASIEGVPEEGTLSVEPLNSVKVMFNKYIDPTTFTTDDIRLAVQGVKQDVSSVSVSTDDNKTFMLDFSALNENVGNGYFVLTINTSDVKDVDGYLGKNGKQTGWIMFRNGLVSLSATTYPAIAGNIQSLPESSNAKARSAMFFGEDGVEYGSTIKFTTVPNEGYEFKNWTVNGDVVSSDPSLEYVALGDMEIKANYVPKTYSVTISDSNDGGIITGAATGVYFYGDILNLTANADEDYVFDGWEVNSQNKGSNNELSVVVNEVKDIKANFRRDVFLQSLTMSRGWNWVSSYVNEPIPVSVFLGNTTHIVSQFDEIIYDPVYGMIGGIESLMPGVTYKIDASYSSIKSFKGHLHDLNNSPIELHTGWNWISYPFAEERLINEVISNATEGDYMTSQFGFSEFADGYWEGTLNTLIPGYGYVYKSSTDKSLEFDFSNKQSRVKAVRTNTYSEDPNSDEVDAHKYPSTMNIIARISATENLNAGNCRIFAFAGNELRGESRNVGDNHYLTIHGDDATNITFVVENTTNGDTFFAKETVTFNPEVLGSRKAPFTITVSESTAISDITDSSRKMKIYSIEGVVINSEATTESLKKLSRGIYIIDGQKFIVK